MKKGFKLFSMLLVLIFVLTLASCSFGSNSYEVSFLDHDGFLLKVESVNEKEDATAPDIPNSKEGYTFAYWDKEFSNVKSDLIVTAIYEINSYTVIYRDFDDSVLKTEVVTHGSDSIPPNEPDNKEGYVFSDWDKAFVNVKGDLIVRAIYEIDSSIVNKHLVQFLDFDGAILKSILVDEGSAATPPDDPERLGYTFTGWSASFNNIKWPITVTALYEINSYTVTFLDYDDSVLKVDVVTYLSDATAPANPNNKVGYNFLNWDKDFTSITKDITIKAVYGEAEYIVNFIDYDESVIKTQTLAYGEDAIAPDEPERVGYTFTGWSIDFTNISSNLDIYAIYEIKSFSVKIFDYENNLIKEDIVDYGLDATPPEDNSTETHTFISWDKDYTNVLKDLIINGIYERVKVTVTFLDFDGTVLKSEEIYYGEDATLPDAPDNKTGHYFDSWNGWLTEIKEDTTFTAQYLPYSYTVRFINYNDDVIDIQTVFYGTEAIAPDVPIRAGHTFNRWSKNINYITEDTDVYALFDKNYYIVRFLDYDFKVLKETYVLYEEDATAPKDPERYGYTFTNWDTEFNNITTDLDVKAVYERITLTITFDSTGGTIIDPIKVYHGDKALMPEDPEKEGFDFYRWMDGEIPFNVDMQIIKDHHITAIWTLKLFTISWVYEDGTSLSKSYDVPYGTIPVYDGITPEKPGFIFEGFTPFIVPATEDTTYYASFVREYDPKYVLAGDNDFTGNADGEFVYIGDADFVIIPEYIKGILVTKVSTYTNSSVSSYMFSERKDIKGVSFYKEQNIKDLSYLFNENTSEELELDSLYTKHVTKMRGMFNSSKALSLDLTNFNTSNVVDMSYMFYFASATVVDLSNFNTNSVTNMENMFGRTKFTELNIRPFNTINVTNMKSMFSNSNVLELDFTNFNTSNVTTMATMFNDSKVTSLDLSMFNTENVTTMEGMFSNALATTIDLSSFNTVNVVNMNIMFYNSKATIIDVSSFNTSNVYSMNNMFDSANTQTLIGLENFITTSLGTMSNMFENSKIEHINLSSFDVSNVLFMSSLFKNALATTITLGNFNTKNVTSMRSMFEGVILDELDLSSFNTTNVTTMWSMFENAIIENLNLSSFDISNVTTIRSMFESAQIETLDLSSFDLTHNPNMQNIFKDAVIDVGYAKTIEDKDKLNIYLDVFILKE